MRKLVNSYSKTNNYGEQVDVYVYEDENGKTFREASTHIDFSKRKGEKYITMEEWEAEEENENYNQPTSEELSSQI